MKKIIPTNAVLIPDNAKRVFKGVIFDVYHWPQKLFDGSTKTFEMLRRVDTVKAICIVNGKIIVLSEDQPLAPSRAYEFPGGRVERTAKSHLEEIKREVLEETGYSFDNWKLVHVQQVSQHIEGFFYYFLATKAGKRSTIAPEPGERIAPKLLTLDGLKAAALESNEGFGRVLNLFLKVNNVNDLLNLSEFKGQEVDR